ncbi:MAG: TatD family hydrolase [Alphaproteobacteria bacterium]
MNSNLGKNADMYIDSHCHVNNAYFPDDLKETLDRARAAKVSSFLNICTTLEEAPDIIKIAEQHDDMKCTVGVHPHEAGPAYDAGDLENHLLRLAEHPKVIGLGETGLDYYYDHSPREKQQSAFRDHISAAKKTGLPLIIHTRDAEEDTIAILDEEKGNISGIIHCFSGSQDLADKSLALGFYISISGIVTFKKADELREIVKSVPMDRLLIETDSPYLAPVPFRGKRNEPAFVVHTAECIAELKGISVEEVAAVTSQNYKKLFSL